MKRMLFWAIFVLPSLALSQVGINTTNPSAGTVLEVKSSSNNVNFGGFMPPRVTLTQRNAIPVTAADDGMLVLLTNGTTRCLQIYDGIEGAWESIYCINNAPVASSVQFSGTQTSGQTLTGSFSYSDVEGDPAGTHTYKWYRADSAAGLNAVAIAGATTTTYTLTDTDVGKFICFEVTPVATSGSSPGIAVKSAYSGAIAAKPTIISFVQQAQSKNENAASTAISLTFSFPNVSTSNVSVTISSSSYSRLTQTGARTIIIPAGSASPYSTTVFNVANNTLDDNNVTLTFTITNVTGGSGANSIGTPSTDTCTIVDDEVSVSLTETFTNFTGAGFAATPGTGQLDSDIWRVAWDVPLIAMAWSSTQTAANFAHGTSNGNVGNTLANTGVWAFNAAGSRCLGFQPSGDSSSGGFYLRIRNTTGQTLTNWDISYAVRLYNDTTTGGSYDFQVSYSTNDVSYTTIPGTSPNFATATANAWSSYNYSPSITASVANNGYLYLYFELINPMGFQFGDELGIDNISVIGANF